MPRRVDILPKVLRDVAKCFASTGYAPLIRAYVAFILSKLRFHRHHPEFNGLFEYEEYVSLKNIDDPNEGYAQIPMELVNAD